LIDSVPPLPERLRRVPHVAQRRVGDEVIVLDLRRSRIYGFNPSAGTLLEYLRAGRRTSELILVARRAGVDELAVRGFLADVLESGLLKGEGEGAEDDAESVAPPGLETEPRLLWQEDAARVTHQISPPQAITNPQCQP